MPDDEFKAAFTRWKRLANTLNELLQPIVDRGVDTNVPDWEERVGHILHPADESGLRRRIETLFSEIIDKFEAFRTDQRQQIIDFMDEQEALMYAAVIDADITRAAGFRKHMILFVINDQGRDTRDAMLALGAYHAEAVSHGIDVDTIFQDMAEIASRRDKYGWGSTRDLLLTYVK